jgi:hypothetical protein
MMTYKILAAASLGLALAACGGQQQAENTAAEPAAGEMPQAGDTGTVTGSPEYDTLGADTDLGATTGDASAMGEGGMQSVDPATGTSDQTQDQSLQTDPALEDATTDQQQPTQ